jgi:deazaflavin-dependent oxidoreductase (nitroreductase family)
MWLIVYAGLLQVWAIAQFIAKPPQNKFMFIGDPWMRQEFYRETKTQEIENLLTHAGRRSCLRRQTALKAIEYRKEGPEVVLANSFGPHSDWVRNIQARPDEEMTIGDEYFAASHRFVSEEEPLSVIRVYQQRNRFIAPIARAGISWLLGWKYRSTDSDRRRLVSQIPLLAFRLRSWFWQRDREISSCEISRVLTSRRALRLGFVFWHLFFPASFDQKDVNGIRRGKSDDYSDLHDEPALKDSDVFFAPAVGQAGSA